MKPVFLEFCGINSFSEPAKIDFIHLLEQGIFGIFGDTGSGKSTILDCIGFALYGDIARSRSGVIGDVVNYRQDRGYVHFQFEIYFGGTRHNYRVEREIRKKKDGSSSQSLCVYELINGAFVSVSDGVREGNTLLKQIVGLEQDDFEKCIALPQGEFAQFVKAPPSNRLAIISRLFNLERFGTSLSKRANARSAKLSEEVNILSARLEPYEDVTAERIALLEEETKKHEEEEKRLLASLKTLREEEKALTALNEKRMEFEEITKHMEKLEAQKEEMKKLNDELSRLEQANAVCTAIKEYEQEESRAKRAREHFVAAEERAKAAKNAIAALSPFDEEAAQAEIERLTQEKVRAENARSILEKRTNAEKERIKQSKLAEELGGKIVDPHYDERSAQIKRQLETFGSGDFLAFLEMRGKDALLRGEYASFAAELTAIQNKYPIISLDTAPLIERYAALSKGEQLDFSQLKEVFEASERMKAAANEELIGLERAKYNYDLQVQKLAQHFREIDRLTKEIAEYDLQLDGAPDFTQVSKLLEERRRERQAALSNRKAAEEELKDATLAHVQANAERNAAEEVLHGAQDRLKRALQTGNFGNEGEAISLAKRYGDPEQARSRVEKYREDYGVTRRRCRELSDTDYSAATEEGLSRLRGQLHDAEQAIKGCSSALTLLQRELEELRKKIEKKAELEKEYRAKTHEANVAERLKKLLKDNKFMEFVAEEYLQTVAGNASGQLLSLTGGRYYLRYRSGEGFAVGDNFNGGAFRAVHTLSGGETFLVSLSLALALSAEICAKSARPIEFFFLDEGFGTLDERLVDTVMDSLERLRSKSFSIGIISHVEELKRRIERKLTVKKATEQHGSQIYAE